MNHRFWGLLLVRALSAGALFVMPLCIQCEDQPETQLKTQTGALPETESGIESEIAVQLQTHAVAWRENAPLPLTVTVSRRGAGVLSGRLELGFTDGRKLAGTLRTQELAFANQEQSYRVLVPPLRGSAIWDQLSVKIRFVGDGREIPLGEQLLLVDRSRAKKRILGVCASEETAAETFRLVRGLRLELFEEFAESVGLSTMPGQVPRTELATDALHYCLYDALLVDATELGELSDQHHRALAVWVKAGGRLFVIARPTPDRRTRALLDELERAGTEVRWLRPDAVDSAGDEPDAASVWGRKLRFVHSGLGRVVVAFEVPVEHDFRTPQWKQVVSFFWNLTREEQKRMLRPPRQVRRGFGGRGTIVIGRQSTADHFSNERAEHAVKSELLPEEIQVIPPVVIGMLLAAFAFVVGPLDYLVLGFFRRRRLTWILFPLTCVAFSVVLLRVSEAHLGAHDVHRSMTFVDVGRGGEVLRTSEYRLFFNARNGRNTSQGTGEMLTLCQNSDALDRHASRPVGRSARSAIKDPYAEGDLPIHEGPFPASYAMDYRARQWTQYLERRFRLGPGGDVPDLDWDALEALDGTSVSNTKRVRKLLVGDRLFAGSIYVLHRGTVHTVDPPEVRSVPIQEALFWRSTGYEDSESFHPFVGPSGGPGFDDLPLLDPGNASEFLVVVVPDSGGDLTFYRRLYHGGAP